MGPLNLDVSERAAAELRKRLEKRGGRLEIVGLVWGHASDGSDPGWSVGLYRADQVPPEEVQQIAGIRFHVVPTFVRNLNGKKLDFVDGFFQVVPDTL